MDTSRKGRCGRKRKTTPRDDSLIRRIIFEPKKDDEVKLEI
jgi:hypothetical protein